MLLINYKVCNTKRYRKLVYPSTVVLYILGCYLQAYVTVTKLNLMLSFIKQSRSTGVIVLYRVMKAVAYCRISICFQNYYRMKNTSDIGELIAARLQ